MSREGTKQKGKNPSRVTLTPTGTVSKKRQGTPPQGHGHLYHTEQAAPGRQLSRTLCLPLSPIPELSRTLCLPLSPIPG